MGRRSCATRTQVHSAESPRASRACACRAVKSGPAVLQGAVSLGGAGCLANRIRQAARFDFKQPREPPQASCSHAWIHHRSSHASPTKRPPALPHPSSRAPCWLTQLTLLTLPPTRLRDAHARVNRSHPTPTLLSPLSCHSFAHGPRAFLVPEPITRRSSWLSKSSLALQHSHSAPQAPPPKRPHYNTDRGRHSSFFFTVGGWGHGGGGLTPSSRLSSQRRPITPTSKTTSTMKALTKSTSTPALPRNVSPGPARSILGRPESGVLNTIPDPRTPSPGRPGTSSERPETPRHPDLNDEVATLSTKLINAINHQTNLDDNLQQARAELEMARRRIEQLEADAQEHERIMQRMVKKDDYDNMEMTLRKQLLEEKKARFAADQEKKRIENELENLTTALFQEANTVSFGVAYVQYLC